MARWQSCNVLQTGPERREVWHFNARRDDFVSDGHLKVSAGQPLPAKVIGKTLRSLWQKKLNVALLPPDQVFLRAVQLPQASYDETASMVELQLEKLSPLPLAQIAWAMHIMPQSGEKQQTVLLTIVQRSIVEEFLGKLEPDGFMADRLELWLVDQLIATPPDKDGAWIYPGTVGGIEAALVAWWFGGTLQSIGLINAARGLSRARTVADQLAQMTWAGELEGWLAGNPEVRLVATQDLAAEWEPLLREATGRSPAMTAPMEPAALAHATARRAAKAPPRGNLLPEDYGVRYQQQLVDRIWMRGLGAVIMLYLVVVAVYFCIAGVQNFRAGQVEDEIKSLGLTYTNALRMKAQVGILRERQELKFAALDCWKAVAELLPEGMSLQGLDFRDGKKLLLSGSAPGDAAQAVTEFADKLRKVEVNGRSLFAKCDVPNIHKVASGDLSWTLNGDLNQKD